ncbi:hypothetical protein ACFCX4_09055 [Kitasatospora sp. NPDC056327]|uniref:hypothetical protein n=1 Tax=Kitasatospora sp. NPDC056327 TaxID=3345785 RepID=UPI0035D8A1E2
MTGMTDWRADRRADRAAERAEDRADRKLAAEEARKDRASAEARKRRDRADRTARRTDRLQAARKWFASEGDTAFTVAMILLSVTPAIASQVDALIGKTDGLSAVSLALMLELGAWSATVGGTRALRDGRPVLPYRVAMWGCAAVAAGINVAHNGGLTDWFAMVMGAASLAGVAFWELRCVGRHGASRRTREERADDRAQRRHARRRRRHHAPIWESAQRILSGAPHGSLTADEAWALAWADVHGDLTPGRTGAMEVQRAANAKALNEALNPRPKVLFPLPGEELTVLPLPDLSVYRSTPVDAPGTAAGSGGTPQVGDQIPAPAETSVKAPAKTSPKRPAPGSVKGGRVGPGNPPRRRKGDTPRYSQAARVAASLTARESAA